jgi:hypothetical protein
MACEQTFKNKKKITTKIDVSKNIKAWYVFTFHLLLHTYIF